MRTPPEPNEPQLPAGVPALEVWHSGYHKNDAAFEVTRFVSRAERTGLRYRQAVD